MNLNSFKIVLKLHIAINHDLWKEFVEMALKGTYSAIHSLIRLIHLFGIRMLVVPN